MPNENSPVTNNPKEDASYEKSDVVLNIEESEHTRESAEAIQEEQLNDYYRNQHCRPHARM